MPPWPCILTAFNPASESADFLVTIAMRVVKSTKFYAASENKIAKSKYAAVTVRRREERQWVKLLKRN
jgi:hypothetical protein